MARKTTSTANSETRVETSRAKQKRLRQYELLQAAVRVIARQGYHSTRIQDIADEAGVAYGLVYHYFGSKEKILVAIFENIWQRFGERIDSIMLMDLPAVDRLCEIADFMLDTYIARPDLIRLMVQEIVHSQNVGIAELEIFTLINSKVQAIIKQGIKAGELPKGSDPVFLSVMFFGNVEWTLAALSTDLMPEWHNINKKGIKQFKKKMRNFLKAGSFGSGNGL